MEDAWNAVARAKTIYNHIREKSLRVLPDEATVTDREIAEQMRLSQNAKITATVMQKARTVTKIKPRSTP